MKEKIILSILFCLINILVPGTDAILRCPIKFYEADPVNWKPISEGYLLGMHNKTLARADCYECRWFGEDMAGVNEGIVHIENMRHKWIDSGKIGGANFYDIINLLTEIFLIFFVFLKPMDNIM